MTDPGAPPRAIGVAAGGRELRFAVPGSKSLTNRFLVLAALANGKSVLRGALASDDTRAFAAALTACGARVTGLGSAGTTVWGCSGSPAGGASVSLGDGGTPTRFMLAFGSLASKPIVVDGSARMRERPVAEGVDVLRAIGARAEYREQPDRLPIAVGGGNCTGGALRVGRTASSQSISAVLLVAPWLDHGVDVVFEAAPTSASYIELSIDALKDWGALVETERTADGSLARIRVPGTPLRGVDRCIEPDASSALYPLAVAALVPELSVTVCGLTGDSRQPDMGAIRALAAMGATVSHDGTDTTVVGPASLHGITVDASGWPDGALCIAAVATRAVGRTRIDGLGTLRAKESDRLAAMASELTKCGASIMVEGDALVIDGARCHAQPVVVDPHHDHRVAMSVAVLGLARGHVTVDDPACVSKSWPGFWQCIAALEGE